MDPQSEAADFQRLFDALDGDYRIRAVKLYRLTIDNLPRVPVLPCLDHEATLHGRTPGHAGMYLEEASSGELHEIVFVPAHSLIEIDLASTSGEHSSASHERLMSLFDRKLPACRVKARGPSWLSGDRRVVEACRAQVTLKEVLNGDDFDRLSQAIERLRTIGTLMEKESRVASWGVRTITGPLLAATAVVMYGVLAGLGGRLSPVWMRGLQSAAVGLLGASFLYYGLKAVHLTRIANRVWKRAAEYGLILAERRRLEA